MRRRGPPPARAHTCSATSHAHTSGERSSSARMPTAGAVAEQSSGASLSLLRRAAVCHGPAAPGGRRPLRPRCVVSRFVEALRDHSEQQLVHSPFCRPPTRTACAPCDLNRPPARLLYRPRLFAFCLSLPPSNTESAPLPLRRRRRGARSPCRTTATLEQLWTRRVPVHIFCTVAVARSRTELRPGASHVCLAGLALVRLSPAPTPPRPGARRAEVGR